MVQRESRLLLVAGVRFQAPAISCIQTRNYRNYVRSLQGELRLTLPNAPYRTLSLFVLLFLSWLLLSGIYTGLLVGFGVLSCLLVVAVCRRMKIVDPEGHPSHLIPGLLRYIPWLLWAIVKANIDVVRRIVHPRLPIAPRVIQVAASQKTHLGQVMYANSITLTPGTVTIETDEGTIAVHALTRETAEDVRSGDMDRRVTNMEGES